MGVVYVATSLKLGRRVALKVQLAQPGTPEGDRFEIEARAAARLSHPNIVSIFEVGEDAGRPFLAMELIEGESLRDRILAQGPLEDDAAAGLGAKMADALYYAHTRAILHRDIKPHNILLDPSGEPQLTDFGLAKQVDSEEQGLTKTGQMMGTPAYMPPEQADGDLDLVDRRADVYSLGATLYEALTGRPPFQGQTAMMIVYKVLREDPEPIRKLRPQVDADLETIVLKCLEKDLEQRYASAKELGDDLRRYLAGEPIEARPVGLLGRLSRRARRNKRAVRGLASVIGLALVGLSGATLYANQQRVDAVEAREDAEGEAERARRAEGRATKAQQLADEAREAAEQARSRAEAEAEVLKARAQLLQGYATLTKGFPLDAMDRFARAGRTLVELGERLPTRERHLTRAARLGAQEALRAHGCLGVLGGTGDPRYQGDSYLSASRSGRLVHATSDRVQIYERRGEGFRRVAGIRGERLVEACELDERAELLALALDRDEGWELRLYELGGEGPRLRWALDRAAYARLIGTPADQVGELGHKCVFDRAGGVVYFGLRSFITALKLSDGSLAKNLQAPPGSNVENFALLGRLIAVGLDDGSAFVGDLQTGKLVVDPWIAHRDKQTGSTAFLAFAPLGHFNSNQDKGRPLISAGGDGRVRVEYLLGRKRRTWLPLDRDPEGAAVCGAFWQDAREGLLAVGFDSGVVRVWDDEGRQRAEFRVGSRRISSVAFVGDEPLLVSAAGDEARVWRVPEQLDPLAAVQTEFDQPALALRHGWVAYRVASRAEVEVLDLRSGGGRVGSFPLLDPSVDPPQPGMSFPEPALSGLDLSPDGARLAIGLQPWEDAQKGLRHPGRVDVYSLSTGRRELRYLRQSAERDRLGRPYDLAGPVRFGPRGRRLYFGTERFQREDVATSLVIDLERPRAPPLELPWHTAPVTDAAWLGDQLVSSAQDGSLALWQLTGSGEVSLKGVGFRRDLRDGSPSARWLTPPAAPGPAERYAWWREAVGAKPPSRSAWRGGGVSACALARLPWEGEPQLLYAGGTSQGEVLLWREEGSLAARWRAHAGPIRFCAFTEDGRLVTASSAVRVWDPTTGQVLREEHRQAPGDVTARGQPLRAAALDGGRLALLEFQEQLRGSARLRLRFHDLRVPAIEGFDEAPLQAIEAVLSRELARD